MYCDGLAIAVHVLTPSAGLPDYCASGGDVEKWSATEEHIFNRAESNRLKKPKQFVWTYRGSLYTLIMAEVIEQNTAKSTHFPAKEFPNALIHSHPCGTRCYFPNIHNLLLSCDMLMGLLVVHINGETHLLYWQIVPAYICHQRVFQQPSLWKYLTTAAL